MSTSTKESGSSQQISEGDIQKNYTRLQNDLQTLAGKIGELEQEADEHNLVLGTLHEVLEAQPDRKCFRLVGGVLVERTVRDVVPQLETNLEGIRKVIANLAEQYKSREEEFEQFKSANNVRALPGA